MKTIAVLPGDGIGPEVVSAVVPVIEKLGLPIDFRYGDVGWRSWCQTGDAVPPATWKLLSESDTCLLGAVTSKPVREAAAELVDGLRGTGLTYVSPVVQLRQRLELFANVRPVSDLRAGRFDFVVLRENTEGLYSGLDQHGIQGPMWDLVRNHPNAAASGPGGTSATIRLQTDHGMDRLFRFGFEYAAQHGYRRLTVADKPNVLRESGNHLRERLELMALEYPAVEFEVVNVDAAALWMVRRPDRFGVIVAENMFGDILSDLGAGVMGGLGLAPSGNIGAHGSYFEPVHGSAPARACLGIANPMATFLTVALMLRQLDLPAPAGQIESAVRSVVRERSSVTYDLGGRAGTQQAADAVAARLVEDTPPAPQASVVAIGSELVSGKVVDTNSSQVSRLLEEHGYRLRAHLTVSDVFADIRDAVDSRLGLDQVLVVIGGLGPTADDVTRDAVAEALQLPLEFREQAWQSLVARLRSFDLSVHESNRRQAMFPQGSTLLPNANGTASGALVNFGTTLVLMVPGPPKECLPMVAAVLLEIPRGAVAARSQWRLLGVIESDIAAEVEAALGDQLPEFEVSYLWQYPFVDVTLTERSKQTPVPDALAALLAPHTVSRTGRDAFGELAEGQPVEFDEVSLEFGDAQFRSRLRPPAAGEGARHVALQGSARSTAGASAGFKGSLVINCSVKVDDRVRDFELALPNRGPETADGAAHFYAWCVLRALREETS